MRGNESQRLGPHLITGRVKATWKGIIGLVIATAHALHGAEKHAARSKRRLANAPHMHTRQTWSPLYSGYTRTRTGASSYCLASGVSPERHWANTQSTEHAVMPYRTPYTITRHHAIQVNLASSGPRCAWYLEAASGATLLTKNNPSTRSLSPWQVESQ